MNKILQFPLTRILIATLFLGIAGQSGQALHSLLQASLKGPDLFTGGALGVEASLISVIIVLATGVFMLWLTHQRGLVVVRTK